MKEWMKPHLSWRVAAKDWTRQAEPPFKRFCCWPQPEPETNSWRSLDQILETQNSAFDDKPSACPEMAAASKSRQGLIGSAK